MKDELGIFGALAAFVIVSSIIAAALGKLIMMFVE
jgi:hypothetical protein